MLNKILIGLLVVVAIIAFVNYNRAQNLENSMYLERIDNANYLAELDSVRQLSDTRYARLTKQFIELSDEAAAEINMLSASLQGKDAQILSLASVNAELNIGIDSLRAEYKEELGRFQFMRQTEDYLIMGSVRVDSVAPLAYIYIDSLIIPINIDVIFVGYKSDDRIELQVETNSKFVSVKNLTSFIKVPPRPVMDMSSWSVMAGPMFGPSYGVVGGIKYKSIGLIGQMLNDTWGLGLLYNWEL